MDNTTVLPQIDEQVTTLGLRLATDPLWVEMVKQDTKDILIDHAYCEQKAASSGISLIVGHPDKKELVEVMTQVVAEEWDHFTRVVQEIYKRGYELGPQRSDAYVVALQGFGRKGVTKDEQLLDRLIINAMIEARSCERFKILWQNIADADLAAFYHELMISEAGHYRTFLDLAKTYVRPEKVDERWTEMLRYEAGLMAQRQVRPDRMH